MISRLPPVSIGIPFFNAERFLEDAIRAVFAQSHQDWELILVDDGSTDRSLEIARSVNDPRVQVYSDGRNMKLAARLNEIHSRARYDFVARMDADDLMAVNRLESQLSFLVDNPDFDLVTAGVCSITDDSIPYGIRTVADGHSISPYKVLSGNHGIVHAALVGKREWFIRNPYDPGDHWGEDYRLWVRATLINDLSVGFIDRPLYYYREEGSATTKKMLAGQRNRRKTFLESGGVLAGPVGTAKLFFTSLMKSLVIKCASMVGAERCIVRARSPNSDPNSLAEVRLDIERIYSVPLPTFERINSIGKLSFLGKPDAENF